MGDDLARLTYASTATDVYNVSPGRRGCTQPQP